VARLRLAGRSSHFCPACQPLQESAVRSPQSAAKTDDSLLRTADCGLRTAD
jgi:hypothetical protein